MVLLVYSSLLLSFSPVRFREPYFDFILLIILFIIPVLFLIPILIHTPQSARKCP